MKDRPDYNQMSRKELIEAMSVVMADSIGKLLQPCIERRCYQFLELISEIHEPKGEGINPDSVKHEDSAMKD